MDGICHWLCPHQGRVSKIALMTLHVALATLVCSPLQQDHLHGGVLGGSREPCARRSLLQPLVRDRMPARCSPCLNSCLPCRFGIESADNLNLIQPVNPWTGESPLHALHAPPRPQGTPSHVHTQAMSGRHTTVSSSQPVRVRVQQLTRRHTMNRRVLPVEPHLQPELQGHERERRGCVVRLCDPERGAWGCSGPSVLATTRRHTPHANRRQTPTTCTTLT